MIDFYLESVLSHTLYSSSLLSGIPLPVKASVSAMNLTSVDRAARSFSFNIDQHDESNIFMEGSLFKRGKMLHVYIDPLNVLILMLNNE